MYNFNLSGGDYSNSTLFILLLVICFLWYQGIGSAVYTQDTFFLLELFPFPFLILLLYFLSTSFKMCQNIYFWSKNDFYVNYYYPHDLGENFFTYFAIDSKPKTNYVQPTLTLNSYPQNLNELKICLTLLLNESLWWCSHNWYRPSNIIRSYFSCLVAFNAILKYDSYSFLVEYPENFLRKALFCNTVTFWLLVFYYRVFMKLPLQPKKLPKFTLSSFINFLKLKLKVLYTNHRVSYETRSSLWQFLNEDFNKSFFFIKRFKKINDLIWQDGFLIDFLQKKVVDKWLRGFVIFSGNLFSERLLFDRVVRFYIDFIFKSISSLTIYEYTSATWVLLINLQLLAFIFLLTSYYSIILILL